MASSSSSRLLSHYAGPSSSSSSEPRGHSSTARSALSEHTFPALPGGLKRYLPLPDLLLKVISSYSTREDLVNWVQFASFTKLPVPIQGWIFAFLDNTTKAHFFNSSRELHCLTLKSNQFQYTFEPRFMFVVVGQMIPGSSRGSTHLTSYADLYTRFSLAKNINPSTEINPSRGRLSRCLFDNRNLVHQAAASYPWHHSYEGYAVVNCWIRKEASRKKGTVEHFYSYEVCNSVLSPRHGILPRHLFISEIQSYSHQEEDLRYGAVVEPIKEKELKREMATCRAKKSKKFFNPFEPNRILDELQKAVMSAQEAYEHWYSEIYKKSTRLWRSIQCGWHGDEGLVRAKRFAQELLENDELETVLELLEKQLTARAVINNFYSFEAFLMREMIKRPLLQELFRIPKELLKSKQTPEMYMALKDWLVKSILSQKQKKLATEVTVGESKVHIFGKLESGLVL